MVATPGATAVSIPEVEPITAAPVLLLLHVPPGTVFVSVSGASAVHNGGLYPTIGANANTVTSAVSDELQP
jgi:hypothetical protein